MMKKFLFGFIVALALVGTLAYMGIRAVNERVMGVNAVMATLIPENYEVRTIGDHELLVPASTPETVLQLVETAVAQPPINNMAEQPAPTPTPYFAPPAATPQFSPQFLADCALAQGQGRRSHPNCPTNAAEMLGTGR